MWAYFSIFNIFLNTSNLRFTFKENIIGVPIVAQWVKNPTSVHEDECSILASFSGLRIWCCHMMQGRLQTQLRFRMLWLWHRLATTTPIGPLAWELPYARDTALKKKKQKRKKIFYMYNSFNSPELKKIWGNKKRDMRE